MRIILRQTFPFGRFHANPWRMFPFEDPHGEWPPSPWRLLRAILARSYQWERECGINGVAWREQIVRTFCTSRIKWSLPPFSWRGPGLFQYQPAVFEWNPPNLTKNKGAVKKYRSTLTRDNFWIIGDSVCKSEINVIWWLIENIEWSPDLFKWLDASLDRIIYFGRAESITEIRRVEELPANAEINCVLEETPMPNTFPVLTPMLDATLEQVQACTDDLSVAGSTIPPGAQWLYAKRPAKPAIKVPSSRRKLNQPTSLIQFAIGSRVSPLHKSIVILTQRFRGRVIREFLGTDWRRASTEQKEAARLLTGKEIDGKPLQDHQHRHARFAILFDERTDKAARLVVWRNLPFTDDEQRAILNAAEQELQITFGKVRRKNPWAIRLVPLDSQVPPPRGFDMQTYCQWKTTTLYVPPRYVYDRQGRIRPGETPEAQLQRELNNQGLNTDGLTIELNDQEPKWARVHEPRRNRNGSTNSERRGYDVSLIIDTPIRGPIALGHSSHFGLGLFLPIHK